MYGSMNELSPTSFVLKCETEILSVIRQFCRWCLHSAQTRRTTVLRNAQGWSALHYRNTRNHEITLVQTVQENEEGYSQRQIQDAKKAQDLYAKVGYPSTRDLQQMISQNLIMKCPVTVSDFARADKIY